MDAERGCAGDSQTIGQVVELLAVEFADVTHSSLRFLEREGLIFPARTSGGHRLYPQSQVARIRRIKTWQRQRLSLDDIRARLAAADRLPDLDAIAAELLRCLVLGDHAAAQRTIVEAEDAGVPLAALLDGIVRPALTAADSQRLDGQLSPALSKEIVNFLRALIAALGFRHAPEVHGAGRTLIAASVAAESPLLELTVVTALLRHNGYTVHDLGSAVTSEELIERIQTRRPDAVVLSGSPAGQREHIRRCVAAIRAAEAIDRQPPILAVESDGAALWKPDAQGPAKHLSAPALGDLVEALDALTGR